MARARAMTESAQDKIWKEQEDANVLAQAEEIMKDKKRLAGAKKQAKVMAKDQEKRLRSIEKIAGVKQKK